MVTTVARLFFVLSVILFSTSAFAAGTAFPRDGVAEDYLEFALLVGRKVDAKGAKALDEKVSLLRNRDGRAADRFLKGLKIEMQHRVQLAGNAGRRMNSESPLVRAWVKRYLKEWVREADEGLFRSYALNIARSNQAYLASKAE